MLLSVVLTAHVGFLKESIFVCMRTLLAGNLSLSILFSFHLLKDTYIHFFWTNIPEFMTYMLTCANLFGCFIARFLTWASSGAET